MRKITILIITMLLTISFIEFFSVQTSIAATPTLTVPYPAYPSYPNGTYNPRLSIRVNDVGNDNLTVIFKTNATGSWEPIGDPHYGKNKVYTQNTTGMMEKNKTYYWRVNVSDGTNMVEREYYFTARPFVWKWSRDTGAYTGISPLAVDVNNDGICEIFTTGEGTATCLNGNNGNILWTYPNEAIWNHSAFEIGDLNNDGTPEMVISGDISFGASEKGKTIALHADTGAEYWIAPAESAQKYLCIADIDGNGYPYVYVCSGNPYEGTAGSGRLRKLRGTDGETLKDVFVWRPCWGGPSIADADNDGKFELYLTDRRANYSYTSSNGPTYAGQLALGMQCYDAETLDLLWYQDDLTCSSHMIMLADVDTDGILDAVALNQGRHSGIYTVSGATWDKIPGKWNNSIPEVNRSHSPPALGDCDGDGHLELIFGSNGTISVWDMETWSLVTKLQYNSTEPPCIADVYGDNGFEIIAGGSYQDSTIRIYDGTSYTLLENITPGGIAHFCVQDIDNDTQNELITMNSGGILRCYETSAYTSTPRPRTNNQYFSERRTSTGNYTPIPGAPQPIIKTISPLHNAQDVPLYPTLCAHVVDFRYDLMDITISTNASGSWSNLATYSDEGNGWYNVSTSMNQQNTTYYWRVTASDHNGYITTKTYHFTTLASPIILDIVATPSEILPGNFVNISCEVTDGTSVKLVMVNVEAPNGQKTNLTASGGIPVWSVLTYDDFESGWGSYDDGGSYCLRSNDNVYAHEGTRSIQIRNYQGLESSFYLTEPIDVDTPRYTKIKVDFWFKTHDMTNLTHFWVKYYDGEHWRIVDNYIKPGPLWNRPADKPFNNDIFYHGITWINETKYNFSKNMKIRFECDDFKDSGTVYIDQIYINATTTQGPTYYLNKNTYTLPGIYQYFIWANDTSGNEISSVLNSFKISGNSQPYISNNPTPSNGSTNRPLSFTWRIPISDPDGDPFTWTIQCNNGQTNNDTGAANGTKSLSLSDLLYSKTYKVWVNATDPTGSGLYTRKWYTFTTNQQPIFGLPSPSNRSTNNLLNLTWNITIGDPDGDPFTWTIQCNNGQTNSGTGAANGTKSLSLSNLSYSKTYKVWVNATDPAPGSGQYARRWYTFTTKSRGGGGGGGGGSTEPENIKPIANTAAGEPYQGIVNFEMSFNGSKSYDPDGNITKWFWVFGDNTNGTGKTILHSYSKAGTYTVTLTVTDNEGATNTDTTICVITQPNRSPRTPIINGTLTGTKNTNYTYTTISTDADNDSIKYTFAWGDLLSLSQSSGFLPNGTTFTANHSWTSAGRYNVTVSVTDNKTASSSTITVYIDAVQTGDVGYLLDNNGDGTYEAFYSEELKQITAIQKKDGSYNIDSDGNGKWDYTFGAKGLTSYVPPTTPGFELVFALCAIAVAVFLWKKKRSI